MLFTKLRIVILYKLNKYFKWSGDITKGSYHNYWHFMFGYFLPLMNYLSKAENISLKIYILNCGPKMNPILYEALDRLKISYEFYEFNSPPQEVFEIIDLPRWDKLIVNNKNIEIDLKNVRLFLFKLFEISEINQNSNKKLLIIYRSKHHDFYSKDGGSNYRDNKYGSKSRNLSDIHLDLNKLIENSIDYELFIPGENSLKSQMEHFSRADYVLGVRGAEFANIVFCPKKTRIFMYDSKYFYTYRSPNFIKQFYLNFRHYIELKIYSTSLGKNLYVYKLSNILKFRFILLNYQNRINPRIDIEEVIKHLRSNNESS